MGRRKKQKQVALHESMVRAIMRRTSVSELCRVGLDERLAGYLEAELGIIWLSDLAELRIQEIAAIPGVGERMMRGLVEALSRLDELAEERSGG